MASARKVDTRGGEIERRSPAVEVRVDARGIAELVDTVVIPKVRKLLIDELTNNPQLLASGGLISPTERRREGFEKKRVSQAFFNEYCELWKSYGVTISPFLSSGDRISNALIRKAARWMEKNELTLKQYVEFLSRFKPTDHKIQNTMFVFKFAKGDSWLQEALWFHKRPKDDLADELFEAYFKARPGEQKEYDGKSYSTVYNKMKNVAENIRAKALRKDEILREVSDGVALFEIGKRKASSARLYEQKGLREED